MIRIAAVKYLNTLPLLNGLEQSPLKDRVTLLLEHPADCASLLLNRQVDIALCPIGALVALDSYHTITNYGIGCEGAVRTVAIYSHLPLSKLKFVQLYPESNSSNLLARVLENEFWHYDIEFGFDVPPHLGRQDVGRLCIGDMCFEMEKEYAHICDLGSAWKEHTGMPFVFAAWTSLDPVAKDLVNALNAAFELGVRQIPTMHIPEEWHHAEPRAYLERHISYHLDDAKRKSMQTFIHLAQNVEITRLHAAQSTP